MQVSITLNILIMCKMSLTCVVLCRIADRFAQLFRYRTECLPFLACRTGADMYSFVFNMDQTLMYIDMKPSVHDQVHWDDVQNKWNYICIFICIIPILSYTDSTYLCCGVMSPNLFRSSIFLCVYVVGVKFRPLIVFAGVLDEPVHAELYSDSGYD